MNRKGLSRKNFIKLVGIGVAGVGIQPSFYSISLAEFPLYDRLGRVCVGMVEIKAKPSEESPTIGVLYEDAVVPWLSEVVAKEPNYNYFNQKWVETPDGYMYAPNLQPVRNQPNRAVDTLIPFNTTGEGMWSEVTVPVADVSLVNSPSSNSWVHARVDQGLPLRVYYGQVYYIDQIKTDELGNTYYRANPNYYGGVDLFWVPAEAMHPITSDEITPINPNVESKKIIVDVNKQILSCYENDIEVFYCRVSAGAKYDMYGNAVEKWATPLGSFQISRKFISLQMSGGTTGAPYDLPGIGWVSIFATGGIAIHATVWHNDFGTPKSHGCVNVLPEDAKWIFRWGLPNVPYDPGMVDISITGESSTIVQVIES